MLLNLVRLRYLEEPVFLTVSSILTQYVYDAGADFRANLDLDGGADEIGAGANLGYEERPTITYVPLEGSDFSLRMMKPIPIDTVFAASQQGWSVDILMRIGINRLGAVENMSFEGIPPPGVLNLYRQMKREVEKLRKFHRVTTLFVVLADLDAFEVRLKKKDGAQENHLIFSDSVTETTKAKIIELKQLLGLSLHRDTFRITDRMTDIQDDELSIQTRSLAAMMTFLAKGVQVPTEHLEDGIVVDYQIPTPEKMDMDLIPFRMSCSRDRPQNPFAAVRYLDYWFYIDNRDFNSKRALGLVINLFRILAPSGGGASPVLTLPAG